MVIFLLSSPGLYQMSLAYGMVQAVGFRYTRWQLESMRDCNLWLQKWIFFLKCFVDRPSYYNLRQWPTWYTLALFYNTFIIIVYIVSSIIRSSSGGWIVLMQHLVSSLSLSGCLVHRLRENCSLSTCALDGHLTESDDTRCCINTIQSPDDGCRMLETCRGL